MLFSKGELLTYSALADFAPTPAHANFSYPAGASLQLVPMIMELVVPIKSQRRYLIVGTSYKLAPAEASLQLVPMIMELVAPIKSQRPYLIVGTSCKLAPAEADQDTPH